MKHYHFNEVSSTNDFAKELLKYDPVVCVTADHQLVGRGRNQKTWEGEFGENIYFSLGINHTKTAEEIHPAAYQAIGCLAAKAAIVEATEQPAFYIKYPNDIVAVDSGHKIRKVSGILIEHSFSGDKCVSTVIGIGINVLQSKFTGDLADKAISLRTLGYDIKMESLVELLIKHCEIYFDSSPSEALGQWKAELGIVGKLLEVQGEKGLWAVEEILDDGRLRVKENSGDNIKLIDNGDTIRYNIF